MDEIYINDEEFTELCDAIYGWLFWHKFDESEQRNSMNNVYSDVQETVITENYTLDLSMFISMTRMCFERMKKSVETFGKIGLEMHSVDALIEKCINGIKNNGEK